MKVWNQYGSEHSMNLVMIGSFIREAFVHFDKGRWQTGIPVEVPVYGFAWESYHSELNQSGSTNVLAPALFEKLQLSNRGGEWDFYDPAGRVATIYREFKNAGDRLSSHFLFLRSDLMSAYLENDIELVWLVWGERNLSYEGMMHRSEELRAAFAGHRHIHRFSRRWVG